MASPASSTPAPEASSAPPAASAKGLRVALYSGNYDSVRDGANKALNRLVGHLLDRGATVQIDFTPAKSGEIAFSCGMNMLKGAVAVQ